MSTSSRHRSSTRSSAGGEDTTTVEDRRRELRHDLPKPIHLIPCAADREWAAVPAEMVDCSRHGIGIIVDQPLNKGEQFLVRLPLDRARLLIYTVRHCQPAAGYRYQVGAEFSGFTAFPCDLSGDAILDALMQLDV